MNKKLWFYVVILALVIMYPISVFSDGYALYSLGGDAGGRAEAVSASVDDASAIWYNPARMTYVNGKNLVVGFNNMSIDFTVKSLVDKKSYDSSADSFILPNLYYVHPLGDQLSLGIGVNSPFGLGVEYDKNAPFAALITSNELMITNIMPAVGYKVNDKLSIGGGLMIYLIDGEATKYFTSTSKVKLEADATQIGGMFGVSYQLSEKHSFSFVYRSQMRFWLEGDASFSNIPFPGDNSTLGVKADNITPDAVILGYANKFSEKLLVEVNLNWRNWNDLKSSTVDFDTISPLGVKTTVTDRNWRNAGELAVGAQYTINDNWAVDGGLMYSMTPVREAYATLEIPDSNYYLISTGPVYTKDSLKVSLPIAYLSNFKKDINSNNALYNGEWDLSVLHIGLGVSWMF